MKLFSALVLLACLCSCSVVKDTPKYEISEGKHFLKTRGSPQKNVYAVEEDGFLKLYPLKKESSKYVVDTLSHIAIDFTGRRFESAGEAFSLRKTSLDIDFQTIPFKFRFPKQGFPRQFNANLNGGVYVGYRTDVYHISHQTNPLGKSEVKKTHVGFSFGGYSGIGGTAMNPWVTKNQVDIEYDGVVWTNGLVTIMGLNKFTVGLALGWDRLLDDNRKYWIYEKQPWLGFVVGLNLN